MPEIGPIHPLTYRQEIAAPLFDLLRASESSAVISPASMGKSRLLQFLLRPDVQQHYLAETAATTWLVLVDCQRRAEISEWGLYELLLTSLTEAVGDRLDPALRNWFNDLHREAIISSNALLARRYVELMARVLCREHGLKLCFIFDEFDEIYGIVPPSALANLRALRDADRYSLCYLLMVRDHPARLRSPSDNEGFYELVSRSILGLKPYTEADARRVIAQLVARRRHVITENQENALLQLSGGHPGLLVALFDVLLHPEAGFPDEDLTGWALAQPQVVEECRKLWNGLAQDEQLALSRLAQGIGAAYALRELLTLKGLIQPIERDEVRLFSPVFREYVLTQGSLSERELWLDEGTEVVWVEGRRVADLTRLEFQLLRHLYRRLGQVCTRDEIIGILYPSETLDPDGAGTENRVDSLMRHLRKSVEPVPEHPRYLLTVRGRGYKLVDTPESVTAQ